VASLPVSLEISTLPGLADVTLRELRARFRAGEALKRVPPQVHGSRERADAITLALPAPSLAAAHDLRTAVALFRVLPFAVPRPKALLGDAVARSWREQLQQHLAQAKVPFASLRLEGAGRESAVLQRLAEQLAEAAGVPLDDAAGELLVRLRREGEGWALLLRTTPRPLSVRSYRVCDRPGGLNASLAAALLLLAAPAPGAHIVDPFSGSGTLAIEGARADPHARVDAFDLEPEACACAARNVAAAGVGARVQLRVGDARDLPLPDAGVDLMLANPPWGDTHGDRALVEALYPAFLTEAARVLRPGGRLALVTQQVTFAQGLLAEDRRWRLLHERRVWHGGHHPWVALLERRGRPDERSGGRLR
jgi:tRNA (guanine6-N2)-methyltransferase